MDNGMWLLLSVAVSAGLAMIGFIMAKRAKKRKLFLLGQDEGEEGQGDLLATKQIKAVKRRQRLWFMLGVLGLWAVVGQLITLVYGPAHEEALAVEIMAPRTSVFGLDVSVTILAMWVAMVCIAVLALVFRFFILPKFADVPKGIQNAIEVMVETIDSYARERGGHLGRNLSAYIFSTVVLLVACAVTELFGQRAPSADLVMTFSLAIVTFLLINYYGIKKKGLAGRIKSMSRPTPVILPMKILSDIAVPVSLACRLFGNMLGGMIVMELIYLALGNMAVGIPPIAGLYFNVFHPLIQTYIFITLSLTFIGEAVEEEEEHSPAPE